MKRLTAPAMDYWLRHLGKLGLENSNHLPLNEESTKLFEKICEATECLAYTRFLRKEMWLCLKRGTFEEYCEAAGIPADQASGAEAVFNHYDETEEKWYRLYIKDTDEKGNAVSGVFLWVCTAKSYLETEYMLGLDPEHAENTEPADVSEFLCLLLPEIERTVNEIKNGSYQIWLRKNLPYCYRTGSITRKKFWELYPERKEEFYGLLTEEEKEMFLLCTQTFDTVDYINDLDRNLLIKDMTLRQFFEASAACLKAFVPEVERGRFLYRDWYDEHIRYGGITPKEIYYACSRDPDRRLMNLPLDDPMVFEDAWSRYADSPYFEPMMTADQYVGIHVYDVPGYGKGFIVRNPFPDLGGQAVKAYLALKNAGYPVCISNGMRFASILTERDSILIMPSCGYGTDRPRFRREWYEETKLMYLKNTEKLIEEVSWERIPIPHVR